MLNKELRERVDLLERENTRLLHRLEVVEKHLKIKPDLFEPEHPIIGSQYLYLRSKYRSFKKDFTNKF